MVVDIHNLNPADRLILAQQLAHRDARHPTLREWALNWAGPVWQHIPSRAPANLARAVRRRVRYAQEIKGVEVLQSPLSTLATGVGDCDCLAILWAGACMALGLEASVGGVGRVGRAPEHAVGCDLYSGRLYTYELSLDGRYQSRLSDLSRLVWAPNLRFDLPPGYYCLSWDMDAEAFRVVKP